LYEENLNAPIVFNPDGSLSDTQNNTLLVNTLANRVVSIDRKIEKSTRNIDKALDKLKQIADFKVADCMGVKEFNKKVQQLNQMKKQHKYANMTSF
jgi:hypothetical protein